MQYLLSPAGRRILEPLSQERTLCAFDFDGTLTPIVEHPDQARLSVLTRRLLARVASVYPCVILSGRGRADLLRKLGRVDVERAIGNHGAETGSNFRKTRKQVGKWKAAIEGELSHAPGVWVEDKGLSLAVHYRQYPRKAEARRRILQAAEKLEKVNIVGGKQVVNLLVDGAPRKGEALAAERHRLHCSCVLYVGDDENDEDAFALSGNVIPVRVGRKRRSNARYYLRAQAEIDRLLELLLLLRTQRFAEARQAV